VFCLEGGLLWLPTANSPLRRTSDKPCAKKWNRWSAVKTGETASYRGQGIGRPLEAAESAGVVSVVVGSRQVSAGRPATLGWPPGPKPQDLRT
jgi:hypothetical protein